MESRPKEIGIDLVVLPRWDKLVEGPVTQEELLEAAALKGVRFPILPEINQKIILWQGDIKLLDVDAIVNSTNEPMNESSGTSGSILESAGREILDEISKLDPCKTGEARITRGYNLCARYVIHTVGPRWNEKYVTASENALHNCYRSSLELMKEQNLCSIAFPIINSKAKGYPPEIGCHVAVRTVRRFLEHWGNDITSVIFCVTSSADFNLYSKLLPLYCPRNLKELLSAKEELPRDVGNEYGEPVIEERKIRISAFPGQSNREEATSFFSPPKEPFEAPDQQLPFSFSMMQEDFDEERQKKLEKLSKEEKDRIEQQQLYFNYLVKAQQMDLSDVVRLNVIYESGRDAHKRPVVVIIGARLPVQRTHLDRVFLYMIRMMDKITDHPYSVVYVHSLMEERDTPEFTWIKKVYNIMDSKYGNHLARFYILHPTFWLKVFESVVSSFLANDAFWRKVTYVEKLDDIYEHIEHDQLILPDEVVQHDIKLNGPRPISNLKRNFQVDAAVSAVDDL